MIFKHAARRGLDRISLLTANYLTAFVISFAVLDLVGFDPGIRLSLLGVFTGGLFIAGFFVLALATEVAGMSLAIAVMRISVVIPFVASWIIWNEVPSPYQIAGLLVAGIAFVLISRRPRIVDPPTTIATTVPTATRPPPANTVKTSTLRHLTTLTLLFLIGGIIDTLMKAFDELFAESHSTAAFMTMVFGVAFVVGLGIVLGQRRRPDLATIGWGVALGVVNFGSVEFILRAIRQLSGPFVFPANNILLVIGSALLGVLLWKERLSWMNWTGLALAAVALLLLNF